MTGRSVVVAQREAADAERARLLLHAARVGQDGAGLGLETEEREIGKRGADDHVAEEGAGVGSLEPRPCPRMNGE